MSISFDSRLSQLTPLILLELDEHVLSELGYDPKSDQPPQSAAEQPRRVVLRGHPDGEATLCTHTHTYVVKEAEISNQLLVLHRRDSASSETDSAATDVAPADWVVKGSVKSYLELTRITPKWDRLIEMVDEAPYTGPDTDEGDHTQMLDSQTPGRKPHRYTLDDLLEEVSASEAELRQILIDMDAVEIDGCWRVLHFDYMYQLMDTLKSICEGHSWGFRAIPDEGVVRSMQHVDAYDAKVVRHCLWLWSSKQMPTADEQGERWWKLSPTEVCRFYGHYLLRSLHETGEKRSMPLNEFMQAWANLCPADMRPPREEMLQGLVLKGATQLGTPFLRYFPRSSLPTNPRERFARLFAEQARWTLDEITPFLTDIAPDVKQRDALLLKHTRSSTASHGSSSSSSSSSSKVKGVQDDGVRVYTARS